MSFNAAQLTERSRGLGASEAAAACGLSPWMSPFELFQLKTGRAPPVEETLPMRVGSALEPVVIRAFEEREGLKVRDQQQQLVDPDLPWRRATLDGRVDDALVEAKTAGRLDGWGEDGSDQIPLHYILQVQHQMAVASSDLCWVPVLFAAREFRCYRIPRDNGLIAALTEKESAFWALVQSDTPPEVVSSSDVRLRWPTDSGASVTASVEILGTIEAARRARADRKAAEAAEDELVLALQKYMADAATLLGPDGKPVATWKAVTSSRLDGKALQTAHPDLAQQFRMLTSSRRFVLK